VSEVRTGIVIVGKDLASGVLRGVGDAAKFREIRHYETAFAEVTPKQH
jgi:hypothetical protein